MVLGELTVIRWLDETPTGRILARCTQDIRAVDGPIPQTAIWVFDCCAGMITKLGAIVIFTPAFIIPGMIAASAGLFAGNLYLKAQLSVKREMRYVPMSSCHGACGTHDAHFSVTPVLPSSRISVPQFMVSVSAKQQYQYREDLIPSPSVHPRLWCPEQVHQRIDGPY